MISLNLTANGNAQQRVKEYLEQNVSEVLADKINNGVLIEKDGKTLTSKKTLDGFISYATEEARKLVEKGARGACVEDSVVFGWAIHYFEEDSIEGTLYNEDGTVYKPATPAKKKTQTKAKSTITTNTPALQETPKETPKPKPEIETELSQLSLLDLIGNL